MARSNKIQYPQHPAARRASIALSFFFVASIAVGPAGAAASKDDVFNLKEKKREIPRPVCPLLDGTYDGSARLSLATARNGLSVNEEDVLLYALLNEALDPALCHAYREEDNPDSKERLGILLKRRAAECLYSLSLPADPTSSVPPHDFDALRRRVLEYPVYEFVWIARVLVPEISVTPGEARLYYYNHPIEFVTPRRASVRYIFRRIRETDSEQEIQAQVKTLQSIRQLLIESPEIFPKLAYRYSQAPSGINGGAIPPFEFGEYFDDFNRAALWDMTPGQISPVIFGPEGVFLVELLDILLPEPIEIEDAQEDLHEAVRAQETCARFQYEVGRLRTKKRVQDRFGLWDQLLDESWIVRVRDFELTKGDFLRLYPSILNPEGDLDAKEFAYRAFRFTEYELIRQDVERRGLVSDPLLLSGRRLADAMVEMRKVEANWIQAHLRMSDEEVSDRIHEKLAETVDEPLRRVYRVTVEVESPRLYDATTLINLREHLPTILQRRIAKIESEVEGEGWTDDRRAADKIGEIPAAVRQINSRQEPHCQFSWSDLGYIDIVNHPLLRDLLRGVPTGRFSVVERQGRMAAAYYAGPEKRISPEALAVLKSRIQRDFAEGQRGEIARLYRDAGIQSLGIVYSLP